MKIYRIRIWENKINWNELNCNSPAGVITPHWDDRNDWGSSDMPIRYTVRIR